MTISHLTRDTITSHTSFVDHSPFPLLCSSYIAFLNVSQTIRHIPALYLLFFFTLLATHPRYILGHSLNFKSFLKCLLICENFSDHP